MKIPIMTTDVAYPTVPVQSPSALESKLGLTGSVQGFIGQVMSDVNEFRQKQKALDEALEISQVETDVIAMDLENKKKLMENPNPNTYLEDQQAGFMKASNQRLAQVRDPQTRQKAQIYLERKRAERLPAEAHYGNAMQVQAKQSATINQVDTLVRLGDVEGAYSLIDKSVLGGIFDADFAARWKIALKDKAEQYSINEADVAADKAIMDNPKLASVNLRDEKYLPDLQKKQRQDKVEKADNAVKIYDKELETKKKELEKEQHDADERKIGDMFMAGNYKDAYMLAQSSKALTGDEKKTWANAIDTKTKEAKEVIDPNVEAAEIARINNLIIKEIDPKIIRDSVIVSSRLGRQNKEQFLLKLDSKLAQEVRDGRSLGYKDIQDIIIPKRGMLVNLLETPSETMAVKKAQMALDDWIETQTKGGKSPTMMEVRRKAQDLANSYQVPISQKIMEMEAEAKKQAEEIKKAKQK